MGYYEFPHTINKKQDFGYVIKKYNDLINEYERISRYLEHLHVVGVVLADVKFINTTDDLINTDVSINDFVITLGYHAINDGGATLFKITNLEPNESHIALSNGLYALMIIDESVSVKQFGAYGDNEHDDTEAVQKALNTGYTVRIPKGTYKITSQLKMPLNTSILGENKFTTIINSSVSNDYTIKYLEAYDYNGYGANIEHISIKTDIEEPTEKPKGIYMNSSMRLKDIRFYGIGQCVARAYSYMDNIELYDVYCGYCVPNGAYIINLNGNADNVRIEKLKIARYSADTTEYNGIYVGRSHGCSFKDSIININLTINLCNALSIENCHFENQGDTIKVTDSNVTIRDCFKYKNKDVCDLVITSSDYTRNCAVTLHNVTFYMTGVMVHDLYAFCEEIDTLTRNIELHITNCFRQQNYADKGRTTGNNFGILIKDLNKFNDHTARLSQFAVIDTRAQANDTIVNGYIDKDGTVSTSGLGTIALSDIAQWRGSSHSEYRYRAVIVADEDRKVSLGYSNEGVISDIVAYDKAVVIALNEQYGTDIALFTGVNSNAYTRKVLVHPIGRALLVDNGAGVNGYKGANVSATNGHSDYNIVSKYIRKGLNNVEVYASAVPSKGVWQKGDRVVNTDMSAGQVRAWTYTGSQWNSEGTY